MNCSNGERLADDLVGLEFDAHVLEALDLAVDDVARQAERRNAVSQHAADDMQRLDRPSRSAPKRTRSAAAARPRRAGADDRDLAQAGPANAGGAALGAPRIVADEAFESADGHRFVLNLPMMHWASHCVSCGQTRPQIEGKRLDS